LFSGSGFFLSNPSLIQELMVGDKRDQETAEQLKALILKDAGVAQQ
jgi:hypothetical protein